jgi:uncharacterized repeat protein (TIGR03803 family)
MVSVTAPCARREVKRALVFRFHAGLGCAKNPGEVGKGDYAMRTFHRAVFRAFFGYGVMLCPVAHATTYSVLYFFKGGTDARFPVGGLAVIGNVIYGASANGGQTDYGTIFAVTTSGAETIVHSFSKGGGGQYPQAGVIAAGGALYGTDIGPRNDGGNVIRVTLSGRVHVVHSFEGEPSDGAIPVAPLLHRGGTFYGTTQFGGSGAGCPNGPYLGCGTVFSVTAGGAEKVLYAFNQSQMEGAWPFSQLVWDDGRLYGTAVIGGSYGSGVVFSVNKAGEEKVLHAFTGDRDGAGPRGGLLDVGGVFYGTTSGGGAGGNGTVFSITKAGRIKILHEFRRRSDGASPSGDLINVGGTLYGATEAGGAGPCNGKLGCGTVFSITPDGTETVLHAFQGGTADGADPQGPLVSIGGNLYGVTYTGGNGDGTVFVITP